MLNLLVIIAIIILILWLLGLLLHFLSGPILWIVLVVGIIFLIIWLWRRVKRQSQHPDVTWLKKKLWVRYALERLEGHPNSQYHPNGETLLKTLDTYAWKGKHPDDYLGISTATLKLKGICVLCSGL